MSYNRLQGLKFTQSGFSAVLQESSLLVSDWHELVLDVAEVVIELDGLDGGSLGLLYLGPSVDLDSHVLLDDIGVGVPDGDGGTWQDNVKLLVLGDENGGSEFISNEALGGLVGGALIPLSLSGDLDGLDQEVHGDSGAGLEVSHGDESGLLQDDWLLLGGVRGGGRC